MATLTALTLTGLLGASLCSLAIGQVQPVRSAVAADDAVIQRLAAPTGNRDMRWKTQAAPMAPMNVEKAMAQARHHIEQARLQGDARHWGRAQSALQPWWDQPQAPTEAAVLQATVLQGQHHFGPAIEVLNRVVKAQPQHPQAWLTLATLHSLQTRFDLARQACDRLLTTAAAWHGAVCRMNVAAQTGKAQPSDWQPLLTSASAPTLQAWVLSLKGEHLERLNRIQDASRTYAQSLALDPQDLYTRTALARLQLTQGQAQKALQTLDGAPNTDTVLMLRSLAQRKTGLSAWTQGRDELMQRWRDADQRENEDLGHARERAWATLHLLDDPAQALTWAQRNLTLQREAIDWQIALDSAARTSPQALQQVRKDLSASGLQWTERSPA